MQKNHLLYVSLCCGLLLCVGCTKQKQISVVSPEQQDTWNTFIQVIESNDKDLFEEVATRTLSCLPCLDNSVEERKQLRVLADANKQDHLQWISQNKYVYTKAFLDQDYALFFTPEFLSHLSSSPITFTTVNQKNFEVIISKSPPASNENQPQRYTFGFTKKEDGYKLTKINTLSAP